MPTNSGISDDPQPGEQVGQIERHQCSMQLLVDPFGERPADALHLREVVDAGRQHALAARRSATSRRCRRLAPMPAISSSGEVDARLAAPRAVARDREAVRLVADLLDQVQRRDGRRAAAAARARSGKISCSRPGLRSSPLATPTSGTSLRPSSANTSTRDADLPLPPSISTRSGSLPFACDDLAIAARRAPRASRRSRRPARRRVMLKRRYSPFCIAAWS